MNTTPTPTPFANIAEDVGALDTIAVNTWKQVKPEVVTAVEKAITDAKADLGAVEGEAVSYLEALLGHLHAAATK